jgi:hypothetical protein
MILSGYQLAAQVNAQASHKPSIGDVTLMDKKRCEAWGIGALEERLLDANRTIGRPTSFSVMYGRRITRYHKGKLQTVIDDGVRQLEGDRIGIEG